MDSKEFAIDIAKRLSAAAMAFFGAILIAPQPIAWTDPTFIAAVGLVVIPALYSSTDKLLGGKGA